MVTKSRKSPKTNENEFSILIGRTESIYLEYYVNSAKFMCGGSLLSVETVLTAGHCCADAISITAYSGFIRNNRNYDQTSNAIIPPKLHPNFTSYTLESDLCIIQLEKPFKLTKRTKLVTLSPKKMLHEMMENENESKLYELQLMGYGVNKQDDGGEYLVDDSLGFQCTNSYLRTQKKCLEEINDSTERSKYSVKTMFCHYNPENNRTKGSCEGDSGSPIIYGNTQVGLISWGPNEEVCTKRMEVAARLDVYYDWIQQNGIKKRLRGFRSGLNHT
nr:trypsin-10-like [Onthophagus taurus]